MSNDETKPWKVVLSGAMQRQLNEMLLRGDEEEIRQFEEAMAEFQQALNDGTLFENSEKLTPEEVQELIEKGEIPSDAFDTDGIPDPSESN